MCFAKIMHIINQSQKHSFKMTVININVTFQFVFVQKTKASENKNDCYYLFKFVCVVY